MTNTNGEYVIEGKCTNRIRCDIIKKGYYDSEYLVDHYGYTHAYKDGKWQPYGERTSITLKKVIKPEAVGRRLVDQKIPLYGEWLGYDLQMTDWVKPNGKGEVADVKIRFSAREASGVDYGYKMELSFSHFPFAGVYRRHKDTASMLRNDYVAATNDVYSGLIAFEVDRSGAKKRVWDQLGSDEYLVFRTRTKVNDQGELMSAHYGRIDGEWRFYELHGMRIDGVFFNAMANDTNLEDKFSYEELLLRNRQREEK